MEAILYYDLSLLYISIIITEHYLATNVENVNVFALKGRDPARKEAYSDQVHFKS